MELHSFFVSKIHFTGDSLITTAKTHPPLFVVNIESVLAIFPNCIQRVTVLKAINVVLKSNCY
jgi:hypothetical protein